MSQHHERVLSLIAVTIFADQRIYDSEIQVFAKFSAKLKILKNAKLTEAKILAWYETNKDNILQKVKTPYFKSWFYDLLDQLSDIEEKDSIIDIMQKISRADGSVHVSERALFTLAKRYWGLA
jgi:uncharacterized tellurite resistance protein B-like protein